MLKMKYPSRIYYTETDKSLVSAREAASQFKGRFGLRLQNDIGLTADVLRRHTVVWEE